MGAGMTAAATMDSIMGPMMAAKAAPATARAGAMAALARLRRRLASREPARQELRIDVDHSPEGIEQELRALYERLYTPGDCLHGIAALESGLPDLVVRYREADGEYYCYVEDITRRRLAGYTVFNRLVELDRRADAHLRAPHSKFALPYRRRGLASGLYRWYLESGRCLITGARQSAAANGLWHALARHHTLAYVDLRDRALTYLGPGIGARELDDLHCRMVLLGSGWTVDRFARVAGMRR